MRSEAGGFDNKISYIPIRSVLAGKSIRDDRGGRCSRGQIKDCERQILDSVAFS